MKRLMKMLTKKLTKWKKARGQEKDDREGGRNDRTRETLTETHLTSLAFVSKEREYEGKAW